MAESVQIPAEIAGREAPAPEATNEHRPEWLPEKFQTPEDMAKAYTELEGKLGQGGDKPPEGGDKPPEGEGEQTGDIGQIDFAKYTAELAAGNGLSEASYTELAARGITREIVDAYIAGQKATQAGTVDTILKDFGGQEAFNGVVEWAKAHLSPEEITAFNGMVTQGEAQARFAIQGLYSRFEQAEGRDPKLLTGDGSPPVGDVYRSIGEMKRDMADPRYKTDAAFRKDVMDKVQRSNVL